jgi:toxin YoeB
MKITFSQSAWDEFEQLQQDHRLLKRFNQLVADTQSGGTSGIGKPERLSGDLSGFWSRRIDDQHRLVYRIVDNDTMEIIACFGHYNQR